MGLRQLLMDPAVATVEVDSADRIRAHRELLLKKRMIREVFFELYALLDSMEKKYFGNDPGKRIEIGSGSSLLKDALPDVELTDIVDYPGLDRVVDAMSMPYADNSLKTVFGIHCFHHLPDPYRFLAEVARVCRPGGGTVLIDPYHGPLASAVFKRLFKNEYFDKGGPAVVDNHGPMSDANQALSYIVFERDRKIFEERLPQLEIATAEPIDNYVRYLVSGGVNFRQLLPDAAISSLRFLERVLSPLNKQLALHHVIVIRKKMT